MEKEKGFYQARFKWAELEDLAAKAASNPSESLKDEIDMLRVMIRRVIEISDGVDDLKESLVALNCLGLAANRLANLLKTQKEFGADKGEKTWNLLLEILRRSKEEKLEGQGDQDGDTSATIPGK